jgi:hypothetical protein
VRLKESRNCCGEAGRTGISIPTGAIKRQIESRRQATYEISIPTGAIKSQIFSFVFRSPRFISIPTGAIKRDLLT